MPFTGSFTIATAAGFNVFTLTDTSSYADEPKNTFTGRRVTITTTTPSFLVPEGTTTDYIDFPFAGGDSITIDADITRDYATIITVYWLSVDPQSGSVYTFSLVCGFGSYNNNKVYGIERALTARPSVLQDRNYWLNLGVVQSNLSNVRWAIYYQQLVSAQWAFNRAANILQNQLNF